MNNSNQPVKSISSSGLALIKQFEGLRLHAYADITGKATIGYGSTYYTNGKPIRMGDVITNAQADELLNLAANEKVNAILKIVAPASLNQNQLDSLTSFVYNLGEGALQVSTLLKKLKVNPNDPTIKDEFLKYCHAKVKGKEQVVSDLLKRRQIESELYFSQT